MIIVVIRIILIYNDIDSDREQIVVITTTTMLQLKTMLIFILNITTNTNTAADDDDDGDGVGDDDDDNHHHHDHDHDDHRINTHSYYIWFCFGLSLFRDFVADGDQLWPVDRFRGRRRRCYGPTGLVTVGLAAPKSLLSGDVKHSYWKWPFIVDFPMKNGDFP